MITGGILSAQFATKKSDKQVEELDGDTALTLAADPFLTWLPTDNGYGTSQLFPTDSLVYIDSTNTIPSRIGGPVPQTGPEGGAPTLLGSVLQFQTFNRNRNFSAFPAFNAVSTSDMGSYLQGVVDRVVGTCRYLSGYNCSWTVPRLGINFEHFEQGSLRYTAQRLQDMRYGSSDVSARLINTIDSALYRLATNYTIPTDQRICALFTEPDQRNMSNCQVSHLRASRGMFTAYRALDQVRSILQVSALFFSLTCSVTLFIYRLVTENSTGLTAMQQNGLGVVSYWTSNFVTDVALYFFILVIHLTAGAIMGFDCVLKPTHVPQALRSSHNFVSDCRFYALSRSAIYGSLFLYPFSLIPFTYLISLLFSSPVRALGLSYIVTSVLTTVAILTNILLFKTLDATTFWYNLLPPLAAYRIMYLGRVYLEVTGLDLPLVSTGISESFVFLVCVGFGSFLLTLWLDSFLPKAGQDWSSPFFACQSNRCCSRSFKALKDEELDNVPMTDETEDKSVSREIAGIQSGEFVRNGSPLVVAGLSKNWSRGSENKHIDKIFLHLDQTGVFCLIGANGSGKSTLMEMMAGKESPDAGDILIMGSSIKTDRALAWKHVGICNQGDAFWEQLNVEEHLLLFTRLKGAPRALENDIITSILNEAGLTGQRHFMASSLSGGQKRRLSVAMALCSDPTVLLLDEPLAALGKTRSVMVATHFMKEAEKYSDRVGMLADGKLKCLDTPSVLKTQYGGSGKVIVHAIAENHPGISSFIQGTFPQMQEMLYKTGDTIVFQRGDVDRSKIMMALETEKQNLGIISWRFQETSLEDVFGNRIRHADDLDAIALD